MIKEYLHIFSHNVRSLISISIIIAIAAMGLLSSCSTQRSVRSSYFSHGEIVHNPASEKVQAEQPAQNVNEDHLKLIAEAPPQQDVAVNTAKPVEVKLPPLDQQINELKIEQQTIRRDINEINGSITEMKDAIADLKEALVYYSQNKANSPVTGGEKKAKVKQKEQEFILESDEEVQKKRPVLNKKKSPAKRINNDIAKSEKAVTEEPADQQQPGSNKDEEDIFNLALKKYAERNYQDAVKILADLAAQTASDDKKMQCHYWMGEALFGMKNYDEAAKNFGKVASSKNQRADDAQIMVAESYMRSGKTDEAKNAFQQFIAAYPSSEYMPRARKMLQQL